MRLDARQLLTCLVLAALCAPALASLELKPGQLSRAGNNNFGMALNYQGIGKLDKALELAMVAAQSDPKSARVHLLVAMLEDQLGQQDKAAVSFQLAQKLAPDDGSILNMYGVWLCKHGSATDADLYFQRALKDSNFQPPRDALFNASVCASSAKDLTKAETYLRAILDFSSDDAAALLQLAGIKHAQGQDFEARAFMQRREALGPMGPNAYELAAAIETGAGDEKSADRYRALLQEKFPGFKSPTGEGAGQP